MAELNLADNSATNAAKDLLGKKYGPLPFGAWLGIAAVTAYVVRRMIKGQESARDAEMTESAYVLDTQGNKYPSAYTGTGGGVPFGSGSLNSAGSSGSSVTPPTEINNESWLRRAAEKITKAGMWDAVFVQTALQKYISGGTLDQREKAVVNQAISMEGQPSVNVVPGKVATNRIVGFVRPSGKVGVFAQYDDGSLVWLGDGFATGRALESAKSQGIDTNIKEIPVNDPIWQNSNVVRESGSQASLQYLWEERWAQYVAPNQYLQNRPDIISDNNVITLAQQAWNKSKAVLPSKWSESSGDKDALVNKALTSSGIYY